MFTGLVQAMGKIEVLRSIVEGKELQVSCKDLISQCRVDDSVSINGVCQTIVGLNGDSFKVHTVHTTLKKTTLGGLRPREEVNLELALRMGDRLGGHLVTGHVNGVGKIEQMRKLGESLVVWVRVPQDLICYMVKEGSIALEGISLTIADKKGTSVAVSIIPHTAQKTSFKNKAVGDFLNIEVDLLAKYVESLQGKSQQMQTQVSADLRKNYEHLF